MQKVVRDLIVERRSWWQVAAIFDYMRQHPSKYLYILSDVATVPSSYRFRGFKVNFAGYFVSLQALYPFSDFK